MHSTWMDKTVSGQGFDMPSLGSNRNRNPFAIHKIIFRLPSSILVEERKQTIVSIVAVNLGRRSSRIRSKGSCIEYDSGCYLSNPVGLVGAKYMSYIVKMGDTCAPSFGLCSVRSSSPTEEKKRDRAAQVEMEIQVIFLLQ
jgi:hypothetical protein